jgi:hypothetical protein
VTERPTAAPRATASKAHPTEIVQPKPTRAYFARWDYHFNRNAISASAAVGSSLVAITEAGHILRFDRRTLAPTGELHSARKASALGPATSEHVVVAFESGRIARLDVTRLELETLGSVPGVPVWVGAAPDGEVVTVYGKRGVRPVTWSRAGLSRYRVHWLASGKETNISHANAFLADSQGMLWLGADHGEWGGSLEVVDLRTREARKLEDVRNVYGFAEPAPGDVWALGGVVHMWLYESSITRVSPSGKPQRLYFDSGTTLSRDARQWLARERPHGPVTHVLSISGKLLVFGWGEIFETDRRLATFRRVTPLPLDQDPGRPDAVGSYPALRAVHVEPDRLLLATARNGYVSLKNRQATFHALPKQIVASAYSMFASKETLAVFGNPSSLWSAGGWKSVPTRNWQELEREPAAPPGSDQALVESLAWRGLKNRRTPTSGNGILGPSVPWDERTLLVRSGNGFCLLPNEGADFCEPVVVPGVDNEFANLTLDPTGRIWASGRGLWFLDERRQGVAMHPWLPFMADTDIHSFAIVENRLIFTLGLRGLATVDLADLKILRDGETLPEIPEWDRPRAHEPKGTDGVLFVAFLGTADASSPDDLEAAYEAGRNLKAMIWASDVSAYELDDYAYREGLRGAVVGAFGSADPEALLRFVRLAFAGHPNLAAFRAFVRRGPIGTPLVEIGLDQPPKPVPR